MERGWGTGGARRRVWAASAKTPVHGCLVCLPRPRCIPRTQSTTTGTPRHAGRRPSTDSGQRHPPPDRPTDAEAATDRHTHNRQATRSTHDTPQSSTHQSTPRHATIMHHEVLLAAVGCPGDIVVPSAFGGGYRVAPDVSFLSPGACMQGGLEVDWIRECVCMPATDHPPSPPTTHQPPPTKQRSGPPRTGWWGWGRTTQSCRRLWTGFAMGWTEGAGAAWRRWRRWVGGVVG